MEGLNLNSQDLRITLTQNIMESINHVNDDNTYLCNMYLPFRALDAFMLFLPPILWRKKEFYW